MERIYVDRRSVSDADCAFIIKSFNAGKVVLLPSDTCYGLSCSILSKSAIEKLFALKGRAVTHIASIAVADLDMFRHYGKTTPIMEKFIRDYLPASVTIVTKATDAVPDYCRAPDGTVGIRIMADEATRKITAELQVPVITTSANVTGKPPAYTVEEFLAQAKDTNMLPDLIVDGGRLERKEPSTVIKFCEEIVEILRQGSFVVPEKYLAISRDLVEKCGK